MNLSKIENGQPEPLMNNEQKVQDISVSPSSANAMLPAVLDYFGTDLNSAGHFFWKLQGDRISRSPLWFDSIPFDPENILSNYAEKGTVQYHKINEYSICAIAGSCADKRYGTRSVFWTKEPVELKHFKEIILNVPIAKKIIEKMPFKVRW